MFQERPVEVANPPGVRTQEARRTIDVVPAQAARKTVDGVPAHGVRHTVDGLPARAARRRIDGFPAHAAQHPSDDVAARVARRTIDIVVCSVLLILFAIPMVLIALAVHAEDRGPSLFRQERVGFRRGRFVMLKFRTMLPSGDDRALRDLIARELRGEDTVVDGSSKLSEDRRITRTGAFLRRTSLDELPQLINVLRGDMTLVGPRPCLGWEADMFPPEFAPRFDVRPGLTGLWQVSGRSMLGTLEMLKLDVDYVHSRSLRSDLGILLRTVPALLRGNGAR
jgi:lipopolysaccharide/colanic/teichoic acid biosynthesis glycosyltransferase